MWVVRPWSRLLRKTEFIPSNLRCHRAGDLAGAPLDRDLKPFGSYQTNHKNCNVSIWISSEAEVARVREFVLQWSPDNSKSYREVVRQQWNFSPPGTVREREEYAVEISDVTVLEVSICPTRGAARLAHRFSIYAWPDRPTADTSGQPPTLHRLEICAAAVKPIQHPAPCATFPVFTRVSETSHLEAAP